MMSGPAFQSYSIAVLRVLLFSLFAAATTLAAPGKYADTNTCAEDFAKITSQANFENTVIDRLLDLDSELKSAEIRTENLIRESLPAKNMADVTKRRDAFRELRSRYDRMSDEILDEEKYDDALDRIEALRVDLRRFVSGTLNAAGDTAEVSAGVYGRLIENPLSIRGGVKYDVPQPSDISGHPGAHRLAVTFSDEVVKDLKRDSSKTKRVLRAIQKGYVAPNAGSGIRRIVEHGNLVEIKLIKTDGDYRLMGCRSANGLITILKTHSKHNHHSSSDLKHFAHLCD